MLSWQVGRVKITRIVEMDLPVPAKVIPQATPAELRKLAWLYPHFVSEDDATLKLSIHALLVETPGLKLVVDTCVGNDRPRGITGGRSFATPFLQHLREAGWSRDGVDAVVCTHLHVDHVGWNTMLENGKWTPTFPKARYLIGRREYEFWSASDDEEQQAMLGDSFKPIFDAGLVQLVEEDHLISPEVRLTPSVGHTPGHVSVMIEVRGRASGDHRRYSPPPLPAGAPRVVVQRRQPEGRRAYPHAPLRRMGRPADPRHWLPLRRPYCRSRCPRGRSVQTFGVRRRAAADAMLQPYSRRFMRMNVHSHWPRHVVVRPVRRTPHRRS